MVKRRTINKPGHFIGADDCKFFRHDHVGRWCVSTVGDYYPRSEKKRVPLGYFTPLSGGLVPAFFETAVFDLKAKIHRWREVACMRTETEAAAIETHEATVGARMMSVRAEKRRKSRARGAVVIPPKGKVGVISRAKGAKRGDRR